MKKNGLLAVVAAMAVAVIVSAAPAFAEQVPWNGMLVDAATAAAQPEVRGGTQPAGDAPDVYGTSGWGGYAVGPCDAFVRNYAGYVQALGTSCEKIEPIADGNLAVGFPIHVPSGASLQYLRIYYYGTAGSGAISGGLYKTQGGTNTLIIGASPAATTSSATMQEFGPFAEEVNNAPSSGYAYHFLAIMNKAGAAVNGIHKVYVYYKLQVSPAPGTATFSDVPVGYWARQYIEALAASGITGGCGAGVFCPGNNVTRAEMAVFLAKALGLAYEY